MYTIQRFSMPAAKPNAVASPGHREGEIRVKKEDYDVTLKIAKSIAAHAQDYILRQAQKQQERLHSSGVPDNLQANLHNELTMAARKFSYQERLLARSQGRELANIPFGQALQPKLKFVANALPKPAPKPGYSDMSFWGIFHHPEGQVQDFRSIVDLQPKTIALMEEALSKRLNDHRIPHTKEPFKGYNA